MAHTVSSDRIATLAAAWSLATITLFGCTTTEIPEVAPGDSGSKGEPDSTIIDAADARAEDTDLSRDGAGDVQPADIQQADAEESTDAGDTDRPTDTTADEDTTGGGSCTGDTSRPCGFSTGVCEQGTQSCNAGSWGACKGGVNPSDEVCDGLDNDCDGEIDEELTRSCGSDMGICESGTETCRDGSWGECRGGVVASKEVCKPDDKDEDCDGTVNENCPCLNGEQRPCGTDKGVCTTGTQTCQDKKWGNCMGQTTGGKEVCDGKDNDCDGDIDEGLTRSCGKSNGQCQTGTETCNNGNWGSCSGRVAPSKEVCDGKDNDCDGKVDESVTRSCGKSTGQCQTGTETCNNGSWSSCSGSVGPTSEVCDRKDNDCDGRVDNGVTRPCGLSTGVCREGTETCSRGSWGRCSGHIGPSREVCDGKDNNCDGNIDESLSRACGKSTGVCTTGVETCKSGSWGSCSGTSPSKETCNGKDDDCDRKTDEGVINIYYRDNDGDGYGTGTTIQACSEPPGYASKDGDCNDNASGIHPNAAERCDPIDQDCDGDIAEGPCPSPCTCNSRGVCVDRNGSKFCIQ